MVLFLHNRYRTTGGEERVVEDLAWLVRERIGEPVELLARFSEELGSGKAALGLLRGGLDPREVGEAVRRTGARVVHAHNLQPAFGWRALAAARAAGARVVLHLHQYRLVCAVGVCFTAGEECTRCHGRNTLPGLYRNCRGSRPEAAAYAASLGLWQRRIVQQADVVVVPSEFARERLRALGAPLPWERVHVLAPPLRGLDLAPPPPPQASGTASYALVVSRLAPEKGIDVAIDACRAAGISLVVAGDGPERASLEARAADGPAVAGATVRFLGRVEDAELARLRADASIALVPSRSAETFGLAAAEAMAAGLPVVAGRVGALPELLEEDALVAPGDPVELARAIERLAGDRQAAARGLARVRAVCAPEAVAATLGELYRADG
ncbi:MAG TPA: glycosyltransferase family 4 protein [Solirubrobacteraceae bacterium]|jgi:glycosyltransferase involved in cell wall biosynthesis|nr:glycosyltransferase family 4 protein [Solirubrobacteraceae bacterium]